MNNGNRVHHKANKICNANNLLSIMFIPIFCCACSAIQRINKLIACGFTIKKYRVMSGPLKVPACFLLSLADADSTAQSLNRS